MTSAQVRKPGGGEDSAELSALSNCQSMRENSDFNQFSQRGENVPITNRQMLPSVNLVATTRVSVGAAANPQLIPSYSPHPSKQSEHDNKLVRMVASQNFRSPLLKNQTQRHERVISRPQSMLFAYQSPPLAGDRNYDDSEDER